MITKEEKILGITNQLKAIYKIRLHLNDIFIDDIKAYQEANELLLNSEHELWKEVDSDEEGSE